jgi:beta-1,2-xylosyltransferase
VCTRGSELTSDPYLIPLHGLLLSPHDAGSHPRPHTQLLPLFSLAKTSINSDILITPLDMFHDSTGEDPVWEQKRDLRLAWVSTRIRLSLRIEGKLYRYFKNDQGFRLA